MSFVLAQFVQEFEQAPSIEQVHKLKKPELLEVCKHYELSVKAVMRKAKIKSILVKYMVDEDMLEPEVLEDIDIDEKDLTEMRRLELEYQFKIEEMKKEKEREEREAQREKEREERQLQREWQLRQEQLEKERQIREEEKIRERELREEKKIHEELRLKHELEMKKLELKAQFGETDPDDRPFDVGKVSRLVPTFQEKEVEKYFLHFEKVAQQLKWPEEYWAVLLQSRLIGKAHETYAALPADQSTDYETVKKAILKAYELVPEAYRQKFRHCKKQEGQTYVEFAKDKETLFDRWCISKEIGQDFGKLRQLMLIEEFKRCIAPEIRTHLDERQAENLHQAATFADDYALTHKSSFRPSNSKPSQRDMVKRRTEYQSMARNVDSKIPSKKDNTGGSTSETHPKKVSTFPKLVCSYCKKHGHVMTDCWFLQKKNGQKSTSALAYIKQVPRFKQEDFLSPDEVHDGYKPFVSDGYVSLCDGSVPQKPIRILRDTGASQSLMLANVLPLSDKTTIGASVLMQGIECGSIEVPLHNVLLKSDLKSGPVIVGIRPSLPVEGVDFLLGNDLAGGKVKPGPIVTPKPVIEDATERLGEDIPGIFPACAVTRSMAKRAEAEAVGESEVVDLSQTFVNHEDHGFEHTQEAEVETQGTEGSSEDRVAGPTENKIIQDQKEDPDLMDIYANAGGESDVEASPVGYYKKKGVLMRKWRPADAAPEDDWRILYQLVVPKIYRAKIMSLAHEDAMSGHQGVRKTHDRVSQHFYWPGLKKDIAEFCRTCHTCQVVGKPNQNIPKAPLKPIPAFEEPFSRVIVDCVGPLPKTRLGNQYLLTIMCASTRFPEAIPLRKITANVIVKALIKFFTLFGLPRTIQSDQGTNFMSKIFQQVMYQLGVKQFKSSAYHPESQGALERFHQSLKTMIKAYCVENEKDWDEGVPLLLFAAREVVQESIGFSPFELVFGRRPRGPLLWLKEHLLRDDCKEMNLLEYVTQLKQRLLRANEMAHENLKKSQDIMKVWYDCNAKERNFEPGDKVLVLFPIPGHQLQAKYSGPYSIETKIDDLNYTVRTPDRRQKRQLCHVNMLKEYHERINGNDQEKVAVIAPVHENDSNKEGEIVHNDVGCSMKLQNSDIMNNLSSKLNHLTEDEQSELITLINDFKELFGDIPKCTNVIYHDVDVGDAVPVKQHPYRCNPVKLAMLQSEVSYMLQHSIVEPSHSNWSSPCILVPKPDGSIRFCTDFRRVNAVTKTDSFPIPRVDDCIDRVGKAKYVSKFDLLKGYWQVPLTDRAKEISAFSTPDGLYQYRVMPFGMKNSGATFQRLVNSVISGLSGCEAYIDDLIVYSDTWNEHVDCIHSLFSRLKDAKLTVNLVKSDFCKASVTFLGHEIGCGQVKPIQAKVEAIVNFPRPTNRRELMRFLGVIGYYRKFCANFSDIVVALTNLLRKGKKFIWCDKCQDAFTTVKSLLINAPVLQAPDFDKQFKLGVDASDVGAGAVLLQESKDGFDHPVCYFSKKFNKHQKNYSTIEKEALAMVMALQHFEVYVKHTVVPVIVYTDHNPLQFIAKMKDKNQRILRWSLLLQEYNIEIVHVRGKDNLIPDALSR